MIDDRVLRAIDDAALCRELVARLGVHEFVKQFWPIIQPGTEFVDNWHIGAQCEFLEAFSRRQITDAVISIPPGHGKTKTTSVLWPMWTWTWQPEHRFLCGGYSDTFLLRDGRQALDVLRSDLFQRAWPEIKFKESSPAAKYFENTLGGLRFASTPGGQGTGEHGHTRMCDDPMKANDARSDKAKEDVRQWWNGTMSSRRASGIPFGSLVIMQRLTVDDLAGEALEQGYEHLCLPAEYVPNAYWDRGSSLGKLDIRTEPGELLWPELKPKETIDQLKRDLKDPAAAEAQYQQNPVPDTGGIIESDWLRHWSTTDPTRALPPIHMLRFVTSWDLGFDGEEQSQSRVAGGLFAHARIGGLNRYFCLRAFAEHMNYTKTKERFRKLLGGIDPKTLKRLPGDPTWKLARTHLIEKKANGSALISDMKAEIPGLVAVNPKDSKGERLLVHSDKIQAGELWLPEEIVCPQMPELENELVFFPNGDYDDFVDIVTQALDRLAIPNAGFWDKLRKLGGG